MLCAKLINYYQLMKYERKDSKEKTPKRKKDRKSDEQISSKKKKKQHKEETVKQLHHQRCQYIPYTQQHLKAILLEYLESPHFNCFTHELDIFKVIKSWYSEAKNIDIYMRDLNLTLILKQFQKMDVLVAKQRALGTKIVLVVQSINIPKIQKLLKQYSKDFPDKAPPDLAVFYQMKANAINLERQRITRILKKPSILDGSKKSDADGITGAMSLAQSSQAQNSKLRKRFELCDYRTKDICYAFNKNQCHSRHLRKVISSTTEQNHGLCPYLDNCFNNQCRFVHYIDQQQFQCQFRHQNQSIQLEKRKNRLNNAEWINCDLLNFNFWILGKFNVIMADPPWQINMVLPYGTVRDRDLMNLRVDMLQDEGLIFLWVTGRAMELGRQCLKKWGYQRVEEIVWIKINQIHELLRRGITGHWLNHSKQHCLVGIKGDPTISKNRDCDVIVSRLRETSQKPDQIYELIQRMSPGGKKIQLFGRPYNCKSGWLTLGNQLPGVYLQDKQILNRYRKAYPRENVSDSQMRKNFGSMLHSEQFDKIYKSHLQINIQQTFRK